MACFEGRDEVLPGGVEPAGEVVVAWTWVAAHFGWLRLGRADYGRAGILELGIRVVAVLVESFDFVYAQGWHLTLLAV